MDEITKLEFIADLLAQELGQGYDVEIVNGNFYDEIAIYSRYVLALLHFDIYSDRINFVDGTIGSTATTDAHDPLYFTWAKSLYGVADEIDDIGRALDVIVGLPFID